MSKRKTVSVSGLVARANRMLAVTPDDYVGERYGITAFLEAVLHDTDNYTGFGYLASERNPDGSLIDSYDDTRRHYYFREA